MKSALEKIFTWVKDLHLWEQDAFRRIYENESGDMTDFDVAEVVELLKKQHQLSETTLEARPPSELADRLRPQSQFVFNSVGGLKNVNAIDKNSDLEFEPNGLTIIYGDNGSGKSGYTRMLKGACYARSPEKKIHSNIFAEEDSGQQPSAIFKWKDQSGDNNSQRWHVGDTPLKFLQSSVAVFDSKCARVHVDEKNEIRIDLYGVEMLENLVRAFGRVKEKLNAEQKSIAFIDIGALGFAEMGDTEVGRLARKLGNENQSAKELEKLSDSFNSLAQMSDSERDTLSIREKEKNTSNPKEEARNLRSFLDRFKAMRGRVIGLGKLLSDRAVDSAKAVAESFQNAKNAACSAQNNLSGYLPGTGGDRWRSLLDAALEFSRKAYSDKEFPHVGDGAKCVLCQQFLAKEGVDNLRAFQKFLADKTEKNFRETSKEFEKSKNSIGEISVDNALNDSMSAEICNRCSASLCGNIKKHLESLENRKRQIISAMESGEWNNIAPVSHDGIGNDIDKAIDGIENSILSMEGNAKKREANMAEYRELADRAMLCKNRSSVEKRVSQLKAKSALLDCVQETGTTKISLFVRELTQETLTEKMKNRIRKENDALGVGHITINFDAGVRKGEPLGQISFADIFVRERKNNRHIKVSDVLSEGEHRAIAIAAFLAEVGVYNAVRCIVFDDPVSSLDHQRRDAVAKRLVEEISGQRQVIIFTHDLVFVNQLRTHAKEKSVALRLHEVRNGGKNRTGVAGKPSFAHKSNLEMIAHVKHEYYRRAKSESRLDKRSEIVRDGYSHLREILESVVERDFFRDSITRFSGKVDAGKLPEIFQPSNDLAEIADKIRRLHRKIHRRMHRAAAASQDSTPSIDDLETDILEIENIRRCILVTPESPDCVAIEKKNDGDD